MNHKEFMHVLSIHGNTALPTIKRYTDLLTDQQLNTVADLKNYYISLLAREKLKHILLLCRVPCMHDAWAGLAPTYEYDLFDYKQVLRRHALGTFINRM